MLTPFLQLADDPFLIVLDAFFDQLEPSHIGFTCDIACLGLCAAKFETNLVVIVDPVGQIEGAIHFGDEAASRREGRLTGAGHGEQLNCGVQPGGVFAWGEVHCSSSLRQEGHYHSGKNTAREILPKMVSVQMCYIAGRIAAMPELLITYYNCS
jgi:hypothetical protein